MAGAGHQFLAGAGLAADQQRRIQGRHALGAGLEGADGGRFAQQRVEAFGGMVVVQGRQAFADAVGQVEGEQGAGQVIALGDGHGIQQQRLALEGDLAQGQAEALFQQGAVQAVVTEQLRQ
ncbi:hypothetical protein D3C78_256730 [compost metagenome]